MEIPSAPNQRWSMDFISDQIYDGRRFRVLNVVDDFTKEMVGQLAEVSILGLRVARLLDQRNLPPIIVCDNGPEFTSKAMFFWAKEKCKPPHFSSTVI
jgi:putative transposase